MKRMLILILIAGLAIAGGGFYFIQKAEKSAPEQTVTRVEATNVGPY
tara:strand:- start:296 stop:436 length:141 start_codon:yes stop_codon:yes gene_type:complete